ncbi:hypothetical protein HNV08_15210 [Winogradskyella eckloniae]|uniref:hypothetical protein n=1 Tax=Winogradskyella eckloniae TaxID=1089306 RepID=UPI001565F6B6|nr:hypothetical protein [Winogradskyella eckloniae]NRD21404.1 hypothetical protein [Winogradskyella eckloniae]
MLDPTNPTKHIKLYSQRTIGIASFIGSPLAAGYLIKENYKALNEPEKGNKALVISIAATIFIFVSMVLLPDDIINKIPRMLIPAAYTGLTYLIVDKIHGAILHKHLEQNNSFYSGWRAAGIGVIALIIISSVTLVIFFSLPEKTNTTYDAAFEEFSKNEKASLLFYQHLETKNNAYLINEIDKISIPKWEANIAIIHKTNTIKDLPKAYIERNEKLLTYSELRIEAFKLFKKAITYDTDNYDEDLRRVHSEIDAILVSINE